MTKPKAPRVTVVDGRQFSDALAASRELAAALLELRTRLQAISFSASAEPEAQREAAHAALTGVIEYLQRLGVAGEVAPLLNLAGALQSLHLGMSSKMLSPPKRKGGKPAAGLEDEVPRAFAAAAVDGYMTVGDDLDQAARRVSAALRNAVPGLSTAKALVDLRENIRRDVNHFRHAAYMQARSMLGSLKDIPAAERSGEMEKFVSTIRDMASKKPS
jgi:hypothetical protein